MVKLALLFLAFFGIVAQTVSAGAWAQFCNTDDCNDCGESVSITNPGCLNENGRQSVKFHGYSVTAGAEIIQMVVSPSPDCPCEASCSTVRTGAAGVEWTGVFGVIGGGGCMKIPPGQSFRFQSQTCSQYSNCPGRRSLNDTLIEDIQEAPLEIAGQTEEKANDAPIAVTRSEEQIAERNEIEVQTEEKRAEEQSNSSDNETQLTTYDSHKLHGLDLVAEGDLHARGLGHTTMRERAICGSYVQFCDDEYCTKNCGIAVCTTNPGCLNENGRKTVRAVYGNVNTAATLTVSPTPDCPCENDCVNMSLSCQAIPSGQSYRFNTGEACAPKNC